MQDDPQKFVEDGGWDFLDLDKSDEEDEEEEESDGVALRWILSEHAGLPP